MVAKLKNLKHSFFLLPLLAVWLYGCSGTKHIPDNSYLLDKVTIHSDRSEPSIARLMPYVRQRANSRWFSLFKVPLATYSITGKDSTKWINRTLRKLGEAPVIYDTVQAEWSRRDLQSALRNMGYVNAQVSLATHTKGKKLKAVYTLHPGEPYRIASYSTTTDDSIVGRILKGKFTDMRGQAMDVDMLDQERSRLTQILTDSGFYKFNKEFIRYEADSAAGSTQVDLRLHIYPYATQSQPQGRNHPRYSIRRVEYGSGDSTGIALRRSVLEQNTAIRQGAWYSNRDLQRTYRNFARLGAVRFTNISFREVPDTTLLDCRIELSTGKPRTVSFQPEGTNTAGDLGAAATLTWQNRNLFHGSELLSIQLRGAYEAITKLEGYQKKNYEEYSVVGKLSFPRLLIPFRLKEAQKNTATSELAVSWNLQNRPEFHRRVFSATWRYLWENSKRKLNYRFDVLDVNYVLMPWISSTFRKDYIDNATSRNAILRYNYEDLLIAKIGFGLTYGDKTHSLRANIETSGNILQALARPLGLDRNAAGQYKLLNIAFAQYARMDVDFTHVINIDKNNHIALHAALGLAYPYGNSKVLPFEKRYFSGGANSVRGWTVRGLGPGRFRSTDGRIDFINQTGDMKIDLNAEWRSYLFWKLHGALFVDAGNIWTLRNYEEQPGGKFRLRTFYRELAAAYGLGLRLNFDYFILRFDMGMKAINPVYDTPKEHFPIVHPDLSRDFCFHFAVGLPF